LTFSVAHVYEKKKMIAEADKTYDELLNSLKEELVAFEAQVNGGEAKIEEDTFISSQDTQLADPPEQSAANDLREMRENYGAVWITYIRFKRRAEGVDASRKAFGLSRKGNLIPWQVYEAAGQFPFLSSPNFF
jgi:cleavage stimulation factor subunit 3